ncbi:hypothetical protein F511_38587 [Dorcoceras hygrometricum]|uniref:FLZ-type domain-containing protein n=1 Tax=Dorcoceras hygrometricum TaxID=472368 RepID=A0A2Z7CQG7_9LAMI|nr:hypothetical protein F511_38587 [Dorcoceras hygrometricum]
MVGLSVILENFKEISANKFPQVIIKATVIKPPSNPCSPSAAAPSPLSKFSWTNNTSNTCGFLDYCFLCKQKLSPSKDLYMYKHSAAWSVGAGRSSWMKKRVVRNGGSTKEYNCSLAAMKGPQKVCHTKLPSSSRTGKGARVHWLT